MDTQGIVFDGLQKLERRARELGYDITIVDHVGVSNCDPFSKTITLYTKGKICGLFCDCRDPEFMCSTLLHEVGHAMDADGIRRYVHERRGDSVQKNFRYSLEVTAWDNAEKLAVELSIPIDWGAFFFMRHVALFSYELHMLKMHDLETLKK